MFFTDGMLNVTSDEERNIELQQLLTYFIPKNGDVKIEIPLHSDTIHLKIKVRIIQ